MTSVGFNTDVVPQTAKAADRSALRVDNEASMAIRTPNFQSSETANIPDLPTTQVRAERITPELCGEWENFQDSAIGSPFQRHLFVSAVDTNAHRCAGSEVFAITVRDDGLKLIAIWPIQICAMAGLRIASFAGAPFNDCPMGLYAPDALSRLTSRNWRDLIHAGLKQTGADIAVLVDQPLNLSSPAGAENPLSELLAYPAGNRSFAASILKDAAETLLHLRGRQTRKKLRRKFRMLEEMAGSVVLCEATTTAGSALTLKCMQDHRRQREELRGLSFGAPNQLTLALYSALFEHRQSDPKSGQIDEGARYFMLKAGDDIVATFGCLVGGRKANGLFISFDEVNFGKVTPGDLIVARVLELLSDEGYDQLDLGIGISEHKRRWCDTSTELRNAIVPLTARGTLIAFPAYRIGLASKAFIKHRTPLHMLARHIRYLASRTFRKST